MFTIEQLKDLGMSTTAIKGHNSLSHVQERIDLAAAFRWTARLNLHEGISNHFSAAINDDGSQFLMNPNGRHFSRIKASELILVDAHDPSTMDREDAPDPTAWGLHGAVHRACPNARVVMHVHSKYAVALSCLEDPTLYPLDQNGCRFFNRTAIDDAFEGMAFEEEAELCAAHLQDNFALIMRNHGALVTGQTVAEAFDNLYFFERSCETLITAYQTGKPLRFLSDEVAEKTAQQWENYVDFAGAHLTELKAILDKDGSDYAQ